MNTTPIELSGCAIIEDDKVLLLHKPKDSHYEFPGGKVREEETIEEAAIREVKEELGVDVKLVEKFSVIEFSYNGKYLRGSLFFAKITSGEPHITEPTVFDHLIWMPIMEYEKYMLAPNVKEFCIKYITTK